MLRSIDLAIYGGINNTGLDSLQAVEELEKKISSGQLRMASGHDLTV